MEPDLAHAELQLLHGLLPLLSDAARGFPVRHTSACRQVTVRTLADPVNLVCTIVAAGAKGMVGWAPR